MTDKKILILLGVAAALSLSGCGGGKESTQPSPAPSTEPVTEAASETAAAAEIDPITPSDYLVKNPSEFVTLGTFDSLTATQNIYEITDEMVQEEIDSELYMYGAETEVEKATEGDIVYADVVSVIQGDESSRSEESTFFTIGDGDYGEEFDQHLIGAAVEDELDFSVSYDDDTWFEEWVGQTVDFQVNVTGVYEITVPEYNDEFVTDYTDYSSKAEYEDAIRESLAADYEQTSYTETVNSLFQSAMDLSTFKGYPDELYASCEDEIISYYGQFAGEEDPDAVLDALGITRDDLTDDIMYTVNYRLFISALCEEQGIEVTAAEYNEELQNASLEYGYLSAAEYESDMGRESIVWSLYENKTAEYLYDLADITVVTADAEEEMPLDLEDFTEAETSGTSSENITPAEVFAAEGDTEPVPGE